MTDNIDKLVGINHKVIIKGKEYTLSPLTIADFGEISAFVKANRIKILEMLNPNLTLKEKIEVMELKPTEKEIEEKLADVSGVIFQMWLHVKHNHPEVTYRDMLGLVSKDNYKQITEAIALVNNVPNAAGQIPESH